MTQLDPPAEDALAGSSPSTESADLTIDKIDDVTVDPGGDVFEDRQGSPANSWANINYRLLLHPSMLRAVGGLGVALVALIWPGGTGVALAQLFAASLILIGLTTLWDALQSTPRRPPDITLSVATMAVGLFIIFSTAVRGDAAIGRAIGIAILVLAARELWFLRTTSAADRPWQTVRFAVSAVLGCLLVFYPEELLNTFIIISALGWAILSIITITEALRTGTGSLDFVESRQLVSHWLADRPKNSDDRRVLYDKILFEGPNLQRRVVRFFTLMGFASVIASMGVITDSTAVVIGAMLIAPLMTPLMGTAISLVMGWPRRLSTSALVAALGIVWAISIGLLLGLMLSGSFDVDTNSQIQARITPTSLDLIVAIAAGAAGAYGLSRPDVSDSLPGVAIAISLVPPLAVVGLCWSSGDWQQGNGALLLFLTNAVAILLMGGLTFVVTGVTPLARLTETQSRTRTTLGAVVVIALLIIGALLLNGRTLARNAFEQGTIDGAITDWLTSHPNHAVADQSLDGETFVVIVTGPARNAPSAASLVDHLSTALDRGVTVDLRLIVQERSRATGGG